MNLLIVLNHGPKQADMAWNAFRLADAALLAGTKVNINLMSDAVQVARAGGDGLTDKLKELIKKGVTVKL